MGAGIVWFQLRFSVLHSSRNTESLVLVLFYPTSGRFCASGSVVIHLSVHNHFWLPAYNANLQVMLMSWSRLFYDLSTQKPTSNHLQRMMKSLVNYVVSCIRYAKIHSTCINGGGGFKLHSDYIVLLLLHWGLNPGLHACWISTPPVSHIHSLGILTLNALFSVE